MRIDLRGSVDVDSAWPYVQSSLVERALKKARHVKAVFPTDRFSQDDAARYYVALKAISEYEAILIPLLIDDIRSAERMAARQAQKRPAVKGKRDGLLKSWFGHCRSTYRSPDGVAEAIKMARCRYMAGLKEGLGVLSMGNVVTLALLACNRLQGRFDPAAPAYDFRHYVHGAGSLHDPLRREETHGADYIAERTFYQLAWFADAPPSTAGVGVQLRGAIGGALANGIAPTERIPSANRIARTEGHGLHVPRVASIRRKAAESVEWSGTWPVVNVGCVEAVLTRLRRVIDARCAGDAFRAFMMSPITSANMRMVMRG
ncbi:hypothetical protein [Robbsia sp. KACC 23696]|uniref:hypothetical protein n=1 Tax=Robbsia sp. KACC 23696 TaxID=3149231 RepID=UPI00325ACB00